MKKITILIILSLLSFKTLSSPTTCNVAQLISVLANMKLDTEIRVNRDLLAAVKDRFGETAMDYLIAQHPLLSENPSNAIDEKTLTWLTDAFEKVPHKQVMYVLFPSEVDSLEKAKHVTDILVSNIKTNFIRHSLLISNLNEFKFLSSFLQDKEQIIGVIKSFYPKDSEELISASYEKLISRYSNLENYHFEGTDFFYSNAKIHIFAHSDYGKDFIFGGISYSPDDVILRLLEFNPPNESDIKLQSCMAACEAGWNNYDYNTLKKMFLNNELHERVKSSESSLLSRFSKEMIIYEPKFKGTISAYFGYVDVKIGNAIDKTGNKKENVHRVRLATNGEGGKKVVTVRRVDARVTIDHRKNGD